MLQLDSLTLKFFYEENKEYIKGASIQKIQMPTKKEVLLYLRNNGINKKLYINIDPKYPHICFISDKSDYEIKIPKSPPMFCMQLRKNLESAKIQDVNLVQYDRIIELYFIKPDEFGIITPSVLCIELMGKYSNIILYDKNTKIIKGSAHNVSLDKSRCREICGGIKYFYPKLANKLDILNISYAKFLENKDDIASNFYYFTLPFAEFLKNISNSDLELFENLQKAVVDKTLMCDFRNCKKDINSVIHSYYSQIVVSDILENKRKNLLKILNSKIKQLDSIINEPFDVQKYESYKLKGDLILKYIYLIKTPVNKITLDNVEIDLWNKSASSAAQKYYKMYSKLKAAKDIKEKRKSEAIKLKKYIDEILFNVNNAKTLLELEENQDETEEAILLKPKEKQTLPKINSFNYMGFEIYLGKNNKQNDYLIKKIAKEEDIWLHAYNCPSSHLIIKTQNGKMKVNDEILLYCAKIVKENSPLKNAFKASIIYTKRKYLKRPPDTPLGYVTYKCEKEIVV